MSREASRLEFLGEMAGGLAHEVKNPLSTMRLLLELMQEDMAGETSAFAKRNLPKVEQLLKETRRLEEIVHEFLRISRGHDLKLTAVDFARSLQELVDFVRPEAERSNVNVRLRVHNPIGTVLLDENYMHRALLNLVQNAIAACQPKGGGDVIVEVGRDHGAIGLAIIDTGTGIQEGAKERIFRAYFTTKSGGTGMGLPIARRIVEEHGGYISFDTVEGKGSRFMILLPAHAGDSVTQLAVREREDRTDLDPSIVTSTINAVLAQAGKKGDK